MLSPYLRGFLRAGCLPTSAAITAFLRFRHALFHPEQSSRLVVRLGIGIEASARTSPKNGRQTHASHAQERSHKPAAGNSCSSRPRFDDFIEVFNHETSSRSPGHQVPGRVYQPPPAPIRDCPISTIPFHESHCRHPLRPPLSGQQKD